MAQKKRQTSDPIYDPESGIRFLKDQITEGRAFLSNKPVPETPFINWDNLTRSVIEKTFGAGHRNVQSFDDLFGSANYTWTPGQWADHRAETLEAKISALETYIKQINMDLAAFSGRSSAISSAGAEPSNKIFIVHGHDDSLKNKTARMIQNAGLEPIILHEQSNNGRTLIEKLLDHAQEAGFAIVLLTADDIGGTKASKPEELKYRARQNVIFELGLLVGILGRNRVCAIQEPGIDQPSDIAGVVYVHHDVNGRWRSEVAKEIQAAGFAVNFAKI
jgi:predicted nucleotide-binding protein